MGDVLPLPGTRRPPPVARRAMLLGALLAVALFATCVAVNRAVGYDADGIPLRQLHVEDLLAVRPAGQLVYPASTDVRRTGSDESEIGGRHLAAEVRTSGVTVVHADVVLDFYRRSLPGWSVVDESASTIELRHRRQDLRVETQGSAVTAWSTRFAVAPGACGTRLGC